MSGAQRQLTAGLGDLTGLPVMSFRHFDCLLFSDGEILKLYCPRFARVLGGRPTDRRVFGNLLVIFRERLTPLKSRLRRYDFSDALLLAPDANFPDLILHSLLADGVLDGEFFRRIAQLFQALPDDRAGWHREFSDRFFEMSSLDRMRQVIAFLQDTVRSDPPRLGRPIRVLLVPPPRH